MKNTYYLFQEGFARGILTTYYRWIKELPIEVQAVVTAMRGSDAKIKKVIKIINKFKVKFNTMDIDLKGNYTESMLINFLRSIDISTRWRHHYLLNDEVYKNALKNIKDGKSAPPLLINVKWQERDVPKLYNIKNNNDIISILDEYRSKVEEIGGLIKKYPEQEPEYTKMLTLALFGLSDLFDVIHAIVSYASKGF